MGSTTIISIENSIDSLIKYLNAIDEDIFLSLGKKEKKNN